MTACAPLRTVSGKLGGILWASMGACTGRSGARARIAFLREHPFCAMCGKALRGADAVGRPHIRPHRGDPVLFWDENNWQAPAASFVADSRKQRVEHGGIIGGHDENGMPTDKAHPWNAGM